MKIRYFNPVRCLDKGKLEQNDNKRLKKWAMY